VEFDRCIIHVIGGVQSRDDDMNLIHGKWIRPPEDGPDQSILSYYPEK